MIERTFIDILLKDRTTERNIIWANAERGEQEITAEDVKTIKPRWQKLRAQQRQRTKDRAEIFTPPEVCKLQNDLVDADANRLEEYVKAKYLEITCGEAPYLVSRYNAVTGEKIDIDKRYGLLDRKLRVVSREASTHADWLNYSLCAVQSVYGYELQGDNLFLARVNVFETVKDFYREKFNREPPEDFLIEVADVISWNLWQMDGLKKPNPLFGNKIKDWITGKIVTFDSLL